MFTLVYIQNRFNRPDTLTTFLQSNIGQSTLLQIDCISPYRGTEQELVCEVCKFLNGIDLQIEVKYCSTRNVSSIVSDKENMVHFIVIQILITQKDLKFVEREL